MDAYDQPEFGLKGEPRWGQAGKAAVGGKKLWIPLDEAGDS